MLHFKKAIVALLLCFVLLFSCTTTVLADPEKNSFSVSDGSADLTPYFTLSDNRISGTVSFETTKLRISINDGAEQELSLQYVGNNSFVVNGYTVQITREAPTFTFSVKDNANDYTRNFSVDDRQISGAVPNAVSSVKFTMMLKDDPDSMVSKDIALQPGKNTDSLDLQLYGTNYHFNIAILRETAQDSFSVKKTDGTDISDLFVLNGNKLAGTIPNDLEEIVVSISSQGYSDDGITYAPEVGDNTYTHEIVAGSGTIIFYLSVTRQAAEAASEPVSEEPASSEVASATESVAESVAASQPAPASSKKQETKTSSAGAVADTSSAAVSSAVSEVSSEAKESKNNGGKSWLFWIALILILLGLMGVAFVVLDTLYTYGILKKWFFHAPEVTKTKVIVEEEDTPAITVAVDDVPLEENIYIRKKENTNSENAANTKKQEDDWDGFFRNK